MMPPGHIAVTWGTAHLWPDKNLDYRLLALFALLPDLVDKPLAILVFTESHSAQNILHALLPNVLLLLVALLWQYRGLPYVLAMNAHLIADRMWNHTETFWWPLFGWDTFWQFKPMNTPEQMVSVYADILTRYPQVWAVELLALVFLAWFVHRTRLYRWDTLKAFLTSGQIPKA